MKIIFMGTPDFAVGTLKELIDNQYDVVAVVTQPDKPKGRGKEMQFTPVKECALAHNIPVYQPKKIREPECIEELKDYSEDSIPVLDNDNQLLGVITSASIIALVDDEMGDDYAKLAGLTAEED